MKKDAYMYNSYFVMGVKIIAVHRPTRALSSIQPTMAWHQNVSKYTCRSLLYKLKSRRHVIDWRDVCRCHVMYVMRHLSVPHP